MNNRFVVVKGYHGSKLLVEINSTVHRSGNLIGLPPGTELEHDQTAPNGNVWFYFQWEGKRTRGKTESGSVQNLLNAGVIRQ